VLAACRAFAVAHTEAQNRTLVKLGERAGFGFVGTVLGERRVPIEAARGDVVYFLLHFRLSDDAMRAVIRRIRQSNEDAIRFAPICLIIDDCPFETILKYVRIGFDDVIALPEKREVLVGRLMSQLETEHVYFETADYLGPDRRRMEVSVMHDERRTGTTPFTRLIIHRSVTTGVRLVRREIATSVARRPADGGHRMAIG
jgi:PleD family two-component response regulator